MSINLCSKLKIGFLNPISAEWMHLYKDKIQQVSRIDEADYIIFESNGDPIHMIMKILNTFPKKKIVFILSGDQSFHIDNECIWFTNAIPVSGLARYQTQIFVTNPAIFKYIENHRAVDSRVISMENRNIDIYFKGTIWMGMREEMYSFFTESHHPIMSCLIEKNNNYWEWRLNRHIKPTQNEIENESFKTYDTMMNSKLCLCPKGNGNSSMRIIEALGCGSIPVLINDFSCPFGMSWEDAGVVLSFDTKIHKWYYIYEECYKLIKDTERYEKMQKKGQEYFYNVIYKDSQLEGFKLYNNLDTVAFGFSNLIVEKLFDLKK